MLTALLVYMMGMIYVGLRHSHGLQSREAYFLANRALPWWWAAGSLLASWFGAASTIVTFERAAIQGFSAFWWIGMPTLLTLIVLYLLGPWVHSLTDFSIPQLVGRVYGNAYSNLVSLALGLYLATLAASQTVALAKILSSIAPWGYFPALWAGLGVVVIYTTLGGFRSVVITDLFQFGLLVSLVLLTAGHVKGLPQGRPIPPEYHSFLTSWETHLWSTLSFVLAWSISPIAWQRIASIKDSRGVRRALGVCFVLFTLLYSMVVWSGTRWGASKLYQGSPSLPRFIQQFFSQPAYILAELGLLAAVMSTLDTALNTGAMVLINLLPKASALGWEGKIWNMVVTVILAVLAGSIASWIPDILAVLGLASEIIALGLFIPILATQYLERCPSAAAWATTLGGLTLVSASFVATSLRLKRFVWFQWPQVLPIGLFVSCLIFLSFILILRGNHRLRGRRSI